MFVKLMKSKLHRATVTETKLHYPGSIAIDSALMEAVGIIPYENVLIADLSIAAGKLDKTLVVDLNNGNRLETYVVPAQPNMGEIIVLGAAAQLIEKNDIVIIIAFGYFTPEEAVVHKPKVVVLDEKNKIKE